MKTKTPIPTEHLIKRALKAVELATCGNVCAAEYSSLELRRVFLELAENGAWCQYEGDGWFDGTHIDELNDREIAKILIREYEG